MTLVELGRFLAGALWLGSAVAGLFFLRYWRSTRDRLFTFFALAFWMLALQWLLLALVDPQDETRHFFFVPRLIAFLLIIVGIVDKNRGSRRR